MTSKSPSSMGSRRLWAVLLGSLLLVGLLPGAVSAADPTITAATGGTNISADTAAAVPGTGAYTPLSGPSLVGSVPNPIGAGSWTLTISGPFEFNPGAGTAALSGAGCATLSLGAGATVLAGSASVTTTGASTGACSIDFSGLQVRPTLGVPAAGSIDSTGLAVGAAGTLSEVAGAAILTFGVAPSPTTVTAGVNFATSPTIHSQDRFGNLRNLDSITLATVPSTGGLGCTANPVSTTAAGDAAFTNCHLNTAGTFVLRASGAGTSVDFGTAITVNPAAASKIAFTTLPRRGTPSSILSPQPVVAIQDAFNNTVPTSATVTITKSAGGSGNLVSCGPFPTTTGVVSGSTCRIDAVGTGYTLTASDGTHTSSPTSLFDISDRVVFTTSPAGAVAGVAFTTQPVAEVRAGASIRSLNDSTTAVTLSIASGPAGATLTCSPNPVTASAGIVSFVGSACRLDKVGTYTLSASSSGLLSGSSASFTVAAGPATKLGFTAQPNSGVAAQAFPIQPVVAVQDAGGNTVTSGTNSTATVTLSLGTAPVGAVLTCTGGNVKSAVAGLATFTGCSVNAAGTYTLVASATSLTSATSSSFVVTQPGATITLTTSAPIPPGAHSPVILWGQGFTLGVQFGTNGANKSFQLQAMRDGVTWNTIATLTTDASGHASFFYTPVTNLYYRAVFAGTSDLGAANSNTVRTVVRELALLRPTNNGATKTINRNTSIGFSTTVRPARPELAPATVSFYFYRLSSGSYRLVTTRNVVIDAAGLARTTFKFTTSGRWYVRSQANPTPYNANSVMTPLERYSVR